MAGSASALVFLNGYFIGTKRQRVCSPSTSIVTDFVNYGGRNFLAVRMDASFGDGWFYEGAGIYRHVWLTKRDPLHLAQWESLCSHGAKQTTGDSATLSLGTIVQNEGTQAELAAFAGRFSIGEGKVVATADAAPRRSREATRPFKATAKLAKPVAVVAQRRRSCTRRW